MRIYAGVLSSVLAGPALALSCLPSDVANSFKEAAAADDAYLIVHGTLSFAGDDAPETELSETAPETIRRPARLEGKALGTSGFTTDFSEDITLELACFASWCGQAEDGKEYLAFLTQSAAGLEMVIDPCYSWVFLDPSDHQLEQAASCIRGACPSGIE